VIPLRFAPTQGGIVHTTYSSSDPDNFCSNDPSRWSYCQHKDGVTHGDGQYADDTYAWDVNMINNEDNNKLVFAVAPGRIVYAYGQVPPFGGSECTVLVEHCYLGTGCNCATAPDDCWWSRYLHMNPLSELVHADDPVTVDRGTVIGTISDCSSDPNIPDHLHFAVYEGENIIIDQQGMLTSIDCMFTQGPYIFIDGFENGTVVNWDLNVE